MTMPTAAPEESFSLIHCTSKDEWLAMRRFLGVGGSTAAVIMGESPYKKPYRAWAEACGFEAPDEEENERMRWGNLLEPVVASEYAERTGRVLEDYGRFTIAQSTRWPFLYATLDRRIVQDAQRAGRGCLEVKCTDARMGEQWLEDAPTHHQIQLQTQLAVTGDSWGSIACCIGGNRLVFKDYERNDRFIEVLVETCADFMESVRKQIAPPVDGSESTREVLRHLYGSGSTGETVPLDEETVEMDAELVRLKTELKKGEDRKNELENQLIAKIGGAAIGLLPSGVKYTLSRVHVDGYDKHVDAYDYIKLNRRAK